MRDKILQNYQEIRHFVNRGILPKTKPTTLAIVDVFRTFQKRKEMRQAREKIPDLSILNSTKANWKEKRRILQEYRTICRELLGRLLLPHIVKIPREKLEKFKQNNKKK